MQAGCLLVLTGTSTASFKVLFLESLLYTSQHLCPALHLTEIAFATHDSIHGSIAHNE